MLFSCFHSLFARNLKAIAQVFLLLGGVATLVGCATSGGDFHSTAYAPMERSHVKVKVSLSQQIVYVEEGNRLLMATPTCVGRAGYATPTGHFRVTLKDRTRRSSAYGYWVAGSDARPGTSSHSPGRGYSYVGYPLAYWVEFTPGYGFHEGPIWPYPRSHGCLHMHETASAKFFALVEVGTPVDIATSQPEDATYGRTVKRPTDYADPDPAPQLMVSPEFFNKPRENDLLAGTSAQG